jgi:hypothetical protein
MTHSGDSRRFTAQHGDQSIGCMLRALEDVPLPGKSTTKVTMDVVQIRLTQLIGITDTLESRIDNGSALHAELDGLSMIGLRLTTSCLVVLDGVNLSPGSVLKTDLASLKQGVKVAADRVDTLIAKYKILIPPVLPQDSEPPPRQTRKTQVQTDTEIRV